MLAAVAPAATAQSLKVIANPYVVQGRNFTVTFRVTNAEGAVQRAPELANCQLLYGPGVTTMQSTQIVNNRVSSTVIYEYSFVYRANKPGRVTIPSVSINAEGKTIKSSPFTFEVLPPDRSEQNNGGGTPSRPQPTSSSGPDIRPTDLIVTVTMSKNGIYEHEAVVATIKVYTKHAITSFRATTLPVFEGFLSEELPVNDPVKIEHFRGENYYSAVLKRCLLYPQKSGTLSINSGRYDVTLETYERISQGFMVTQRPVRKNITTTSNSVNVSVKALPEPKPAGFDNAVGNFKVTTSLEPAQLRTNEAATYTVTITGSGNIKHLTTPDITFPHGVELYTPESSADASFTGQDMHGTFTATYTMVPQDEGSLTIPGWDFVYFNPSAARYETVEIPAYERKVLRGSAPAQGTAQKDVAAMKDIEHIKQLRPDSLEKSPQPVFGTVIYVLCYIITILALVAAAIIYRHRINLRADVQGRRTARANRVAVRRLREARKAMAAHHNDEFYAILARALWGYLSDKLRIPASALTRDNIQEKLAATGAGDTLITRTIAILDDCEMARFTPMHSDMEVSTLYDQAVGVIKDLEAVRPRRGKTPSDTERLMATDLSVLDTPQTPAKPSVSDTDSVDNDTTRLVGDDGTQSTDTDNSTTK